MNEYPPLMLAGFLALAVPAVAAPTRVLFIGNSYTGVNDLPQIFRDIVASTGAPAPEVRATTPGGKLLEQHLREPAALKLMDEGNWDVVVLQGQSQESALAEQSEKVRDRFLRGAAGLYDRIKSRSPTAKVVLYETWARHADYWQDPKANRNVGNDPGEMQARIRKWYRTAAAQRPDFVIAPVGDAWELNYRSPNALRLHVNDNSHPAFQGSYLAGLVIYATIYHPTALAISYRGNLTSAEAGRLQRVAAQATTTGSSTIP